MSAETIELLSKLLEGVPMCFCTLCCHDHAYGYCYSCRCANHQSEPVIPDVGKLKVALEHWREIAVRACQEARESRETGQK